MDLAPRLAGHVLVLLLTLALSGCVSSPTVDRSGIGIATADRQAADATRWGEVTNEPALEVARVEGLVVVVATDKLISPVSGRVLEPPSRAGTPVRAGDNLVRIQPTSPAVEALQAAVLALEQAMVSGAPDEDIARLLTAREQAAGLVGQDAEPSKDAVNIVAPVDGVIVGTPIQAGEFIAAGATAVSVGATSEVEVHAEIPFDFFESFSADQPINVVGRGSGGAAVPATLGTGQDRILAWLEDEEAALFRLGFDQPPSLADGDRVFVETAMKNDEDAISIPVDGLRTFAAQPFVLIDSVDGLIRVDVQVIRSGPDRIEVRGALQPGEKVWLL